MLLGRERLRHSACCWQMGRRADYSESWLSHPGRKSARLLGLLHLRRSQKCTNARYVPNPRFARVKTEGISLLTLLKGFGETKDAQDARSWGRGDMKAREEEIRRVQEWFQTAWTKLGPKGAERVALV